MGIDIIWQGSAENEVGINKANNKIIVEIDPKYYRPYRSEFAHWGCHESKKNTKLGSEDKI